MEQIRVKGYRTDGDRYETKGVRVRGRTVNKRSLLEGITCGLFIVIQRRDTRYTGWFKHKQPVLVGHGKNGEGAKRT